MNVTNLTTQEIEMLLSNTDAPIEDVEQIASIEMINKYQASYFSFKILGAFESDTCTHDEFLDMVEELAAAAWMNDGVAVSYSNYKRGYRVALESEITVTNSGAVLIRGDYVKVDDRNIFIFNGKSTKHEGVVIVTDFSGETFDFELVDIKKCITLKEGA